MKQLFTKERIIDYLFYFFLGLIVLYFTGII